MSTISSYTVSNLVRFFETQCTLDDDAEPIQTFKQRLLLAQSRHEKRWFDLKFPHIRLHRS